MDPLFAARNRFWINFQHFPINKPDALLSFLLAELSSILDADAGWLVLAKKEETCSSDDPVNGWRVFEIVNPYIIGAEKKLIQKWVKESVYALDEYTVRNIALAEFR